MLAHGLDFGPGRVVCRHLRRFCVVCGVQLRHLSPRRLAQRSHKKLYPDFLRGRFLRLEALPRLPREPAIVRHNP